MAVTKKVVRVAAVGDVHCTKNSQGALSPLFAQVAEQAEVLLLCGDLTDYGLPEEAHILAKELAAAKVPVVAVLGNHDFESDQPREVSRILCDSGVTVLDGDACEIHGIGFAGVKGFAGGFGQRTLGPWGEPTIKSFVQEAVHEALKLEAALARLRTPQRIVLMHYSPIQATVEGEPPEIFAFLGSSRLEEPLMRYPATAIVHGHAHHGTLEGRTHSNVPVYNVSMPLLRQHFPHRPPFRVFEINPAAEAVSFEEPKSPVAASTGGDGTPDR
jgi:Icc-related predicted phosphoesterase